MCFFFLASGRADTDLRHLNLPFKPIQNYIPATEIDASISSHPPIVYRVHVCDIPRPDYSGLKLSAVDAQVMWTLHLLIPHLRINAGNLQTSSNGITEIPWLL